MPNLREVMDEVVNVAPLRTQSFNVKLSPQTQKELETLDFQGTDFNAFSKWIQDKINAVKLGVQKGKSFLLAVKDFIFRKPLQRLAKLAQQIKDDNAFMGNLQIAESKESDEKDIIV